METNEAVVAMELAAEQVRAFNHLTIGGQALNAAEVYGIVTELAALVGRLPQACNQVAAVVDRGGLDRDDGVPVDDHAVVLREIAEQLEGVTAAFALAHRQAARLIDV